ncbi:MAG: M23 family metallopeptidase [Peptococcaceae bacterium]|nr:M23 family metallopeptidase [Peptococcaceae bacterium]
MNDRIDEIAMDSAKKMAIFIGRLIMLALKPYLPVIAIGLFIFFLLLMLIAAVYSAMPQEVSLTGISPSSEDAKVRSEYEKLCAEYNVEDTWLVNERPLYPDDGNAFESSPENPFHPGGGLVNVRQLVDRYGNDQKLRLLWGQVHAASLYHAYSHNDSEITDSTRERISKELHPYFYYKKSSVIISGENGSVVYTVFLLVEAYTIEGHYQYHYKWETYTYERGSISWEKLDSVQQILPNKWQRLEDWIRKDYGLESKSDLDLARAAVWEAGRGFNEQKEWLSWLMSKYSAGSYTSVAMIPPELLPYFKEAGERFGIPWWFLAAVADQESGFRYNADNGGRGGVHCYGIMQVEDKNWNAYAQRLGFDPGLDRDNPKAQIFVGAYILAELGLKYVAWKEDDVVWREQTIPALTVYGGYGADMEGCRQSYAAFIWSKALGYRDGGAVWPVPGHYHISSKFGPRVHPITGKPHSPHDGIDIPAPTGTPVVSVSAGVVTLAGTNGDYGNCIIVRDAVHEYLYGHVSTISVTTGQAVSPGIQIGTVGNTGTSTGPHLHFGIFDLNSNNWVDPILLVQPRG